MFGLYATTGRAVSFLAPTLFGFFAWWFGADRAGIVGLLVVLGIGLAALAAVRATGARHGRVPPHVTAGCHTRPVQLTVCDMRSPEISP